jgi:metal-responsive CopG/Arc/MetJ family transcriptional regulator
MHVHACYYPIMRTTIEITDSQRAALLELAAKRGEKGFSRLVQQAIDRMLEEENSRQDRIKRALSLAGTLSERSADALEKSVRHIRETWR